jgi:hypothetical protein
MNLATGRLGLAAFALAACQAVARPAIEPALAQFAAVRARTLFRNGTIRLDSSAASVEALLVEDGVVVAAGREAELLPQARGAAIVDLAGGCAVPGLADAHGHLASLGAALMSVDLGGVPSYDDLVRRIAAAARARPAGTWITGRGWDQTRWSENDFPHHARLSAAVPEHPVFVERVDGHAALVNARALELAGLAGAPLPEVEGGRILTDGSGAPSGVLIDNASVLVERVIPAPDRSELLRRYEAAQAACLAQGLTVVHDMGLEADELAALVELERRGRLALRVRGYLWGNDGLPPELLGAHPDAHDRDPRARLAIVGVKLQLDGALGSRGAALLEPYGDDPGNCGLLLLEPARYAELVRLAWARGLAPATHAIGDRANRIVLDVYESALAADPTHALRPRVEHAQVVAPEDQPRFALLGVVPSMQPTHATSDMRWAEARLGSERLHGAYAWRRLASPSSPLAGGSDFPVERVSPLEGLYAARTRRDRDGNPPGGWQADQALTASEALEAFSAGAAFAAGEEERRGKLRPGYFADMTVLDVDPIECAPQALLGARVLRTIIEGEVVWAAPGTGD